MAKFFDALNKTISDPMFGLATGLLGGAAPGGTLGSGMQQGLLNSQAMQQQAAAQQDQATRTGLLQSADARAQQELEWEMSQPPEMTDFMRKLELLRTDPAAAQQYADIYGSGGVNLDLNLGPTTPGMEATDKAMATTAVEEYGGAAADRVKLMAQLDDAVMQLESGADNLTGPLIGMVPDFVKRFTNPEAIDTREMVEEVVQRNLKAVLGAQFTEKEGERLIARAYNENLSEATNAQRVKRLLMQMQLAHRMKAEALDYFESNKTMEGYTGRQPRMEDFFDVLDKLEEENKTGPINREGWSIKKVP